MSSTAPPRKHWCRLSMKTYPKWIISITALNGYSMPTAMPIRRMPPNCRCCQLRMRPKLLNWLPVTPKIFSRLPIGWNWPQAYLMSRLRNPIMSLKNTIQPGKQQLSPSQRPQIPWPVNPTVGSPFTSKASRPSMSCEVNWILSWDWSKRRSLQPKPLKIRPWPPNGIPASNCCSMPTGMPIRPRRPCWNSSMSRIWHNSRPSLRSIRPTSSRL